ncbi:ATP synthase subunit I [Terrilactibacillus tamarindi]|uniref:ATP synthase subunit I n=1 Tax=Terrilactibacillus tamarindi TaxID=2599694 RepID=UPI001E5D9F19|nr:ATP synthase subunit I [Terrilactibacillus tamarindi]
MAWSYRVMLVIYVCLLLFTSLLWIALPIKSLLAGFALGMSISFYNILQIILRTQIASKEVLKGSRKRRGLNSFTRYLAVAFGVLLIYRYPTWFDFRVFVFSLPIGYVLLVLINIYYGRRERQSLERGDKFWK